MSGKMEGEDKSKKVAKEKRSAKKTKAVALPVEEVSAVAEPKKTPVRKSAGAAPAMRSVRSTRAKEPGYEQIQLRTYFIGDLRNRMGILGDETSSWYPAERVLIVQMATN